LVVWFAASEQVVFGDTDIDPDGTFENPERVGAATVIAVPFVLNRLSVNDGIVLIAVLAYPCGAETVIDPGLTAIPLPTYR
jgi:hypothetical protein